MLSTMPIAVPTASPEKKPLRVLFFPKTGFASKNFFPKSIGQPPPVITGMALLML